MPALPNLGGDSVQAGATSKGSKNELEHANAAFLGALHASSVPADDMQEGNYRAYPDGSFIMNPTRNKSGAKRLGGQNRLSQPQSDSDSNFLMAVQNSQSSYSSSAWQSGSGTLVLNSPKATDNSVDSSNDAFMLAIHASGVDESVNTSALEGGRCDESGEEKDVAIEEEEEFDEDIEGVKIPHQPYVEKVLMPRPLFFGHVLPPRITQEAERAALMHTADCDAGGRERTHTGDSDHKETSSAAPSSTESMSNADGEGQGLDDSSFHSRSSFTSRGSFATTGGAKFESPFAPCCRNLEGAMEAFGYGVNPFATVTHQVEEENEPDEPVGPHPYVSIYSPVWDEWEEAKPAAKDRRRHKKSVSMDLMDSLRDSAVTLPVGTEKIAPSQPKLPQLPVHTVGTAMSSISSTETFLRYARAGSAEGAERDTFRGGSDAEVDGSGTFVSNMLPKMDSSTFVQAVKCGDGASDDDSIEAAEERTAVGLNDNISAAAAMLAGEGVDDYNDDSRGIGTSMFVAAGGGAKAANKYGRPYSNFELLNGITPEFGCDDPSLPHESDLGVFETKEDEKRCAERRRERNMIEEFAMPGIMPHVTCPTHCLDVDDSSSWNSRVTDSDGGSRNGSNTMLISLDGNSAPNHGKSSTQHNKSPLYETSRIAWWNLPDSDETTSNLKRKNSQTSNTSRSAPAADVFPALDDPIPLDVQTNLWPPLNLLQENNMSGTRSHPDTSTARYLPHLSDRAPSVRHLQIDTTAVGFPKLGGEIEPMFCKLAIYHFEMSQEKISGNSSHQGSDSVASSASSYAPSMERCGRVTETLNFDIVQDSDVITKCRRALWPYEKESDVNGLLSSPESTNDSQSEGTSCGIFPLPANLSISNLYAVIIVHKVMADSAELQPYYKPGRHESTQDDIPALAELRNAAKAACEQNGQFITPFAFGVVPLKHIIGDESPKVPVSRAVQIPLFKFDQERGSASIFDHILLMLHPR
jgi:hypothetical protein